ncbi:hypothetical protein BC739_009433 [Kutzneria viridogrisea]|uniref:Uncharacterized protein n=1 Tax=Kutzneria viridogrisea TaxID=47990 RepID=A0ABR6BZ46_9PSEU|nr:hypothetical protein [Kutzneria viridogrisea]
MGRHDPSRDGDVHPDTTIDPKDFEQDTADDDDD